MPLPLLPPDLQYVEGALGVDTGGPASGPTATEPPMPPLSSPMSSTVAAQKKGPRRGASLLEAAQPGTTPHAEAAANVVPTVSAGPMPLPLLPPDLQYVEGALGVDTGGPASGPTATEPPMPPLSSPMSSAVAAQKKGSSKRGQLGNRVADHYLRPEVEASHCQEPCQVLFKVEEFSMLRVGSTCRVGHTIIWESQPFLNQKPAGNALLAAEILFAGCSVAPCLRALQSINVQAISETTYYTYQKRYLVPAVFKLFQEKQDELVQSVVGTAVDLAGDGRCDSPGHSAKYCTYVLYAGQIGRILHCEHVTVHQVSSTLTPAMTQARTACCNWCIPMQSPAVPNSAAMEKEGLINSLEALERQGVNIRSLTTDRHPAIRSFCRKERATIKHYFDTWHIFKGKCRHPLLCCQHLSVLALSCSGIQKKLRAACKSQSCALIQPWMQCITNHLYFVAAMAEGDAELIISMWRSLLNHICDKHDGHEGPFAECLHEPLGERLWMTPGDLFVAVMHNYANTAMHMGNFVFHDQSEEVMSQLFPQLRTNFFPKYVPTYWKLFFVSTNSLCENYPPSRLI
ncbi:uncharacterized protein LOC144160755 [Haemaphysalis longicornis]